MHHTDANAKINVAHTKTNYQIIVHMKVMLANKQTVNGYGHYYFFMFQWTNIIHKL